MWLNILAWVDSYQNCEVPSSDSVAWVRVLPILALHIIAVMGVFIFDLALVDVVACAALYFVRMFAITGFYHRYFSHKAFKTSRWHQFLWGAIGASATQRGPLWWAAHHRQHHRHTETDSDPHDSRQGLWWSHLGWILADRHFATHKNNISDFRAYPELVWLDRFDAAMPALLALLVFIIGWLFETFMPVAGTSGLQMLYWGYLVSTLLLLHVTLCINSLAHRWGTRPFATGDRSCNSLPLALLTLGEGWHNNHHRFCGSARQGFKWWEVDICYYLLRAMAAVGLVWDLRDVPRPVLEERR